MRITVINLARAPERRARMAAQLDAFGLPHEFLAATDGRTLTDTDRALIDHDRRKAITPYPLSDGEIGCWLSHRRAMQALIDSGEAMAAVLEDDAQLVPAFPAVLAAIEAQGGDFDLIDLHRNFRPREIFVPLRPLIPGIALGRIGYTHMRSTGYVVSRRGARKFLAYAPRFAHAIDKEIHRWWANGMQLYGLEQPIARQDDASHSYIDEDRKQDNKAARPRYPDADSLYWRSRRKWTSLQDSWHKRTKFAAYARQ